MAEAVAAGARAGAAAVARRGAYGEAYASPHDRPRRAHRALRRARRPRRRQRAAGPDGARERARRARAVRPRAGRGRLRPRAPATSTSGTGIRTSSARGCCTRRSTRWRSRRRGWTSARGPWSTAAPTSASRAIPTRRCSPTLDPARATLDAMPVNQVIRQGQRENTLCWTIAATRPAGGPRPCSARPVSTGCGTRWPRRCGSTSPIRAPPGRRTSTPSSGAAALLTERRFDAIRFRGPGTDLTIGLLPDVALEVGHRDDRLRRPLRRQHADRGGLHDPRPAPRRRRRARHAAAAVRGRARRAASRWSSRAAASCASTPTTTPTYVRGQVARDEGAHQLGEVALVSGDSGVYKSGLLFNDTLFDENATCHIAYGAAYAAAVDGDADLTPDERYEAGLSVSSRPHRLHDRRARGGGRRARRGAAARRRCCATTSGRSSALGVEAEPDAVERPQPEAAAAARCGRRAPARAASA